MTLVYVAGPLFNTHERRYLDEIAAVLEGAGYTTYLPHRDAGVIDLSIPGERERVFQADLDALNACDFCVALLTGADHDSGTSLELGYLFAQGKPCFGITDDVRRMNNMIWGVCGRGAAIVARIDDLLPLIRRSFDAG
ncbi:MAG: nucleoside 2-deoxyribosyltransferase [Anaerolineae bacterium]|nr:nucleoside 2-deoxyribosyltransferase [Anaerolineae bacterium]